MVSGSTVAPALALKGPSDTGVRIGEAKGTQVVSARELRSMAQGRAMCRIVAKQERRSGNESRYDSAKQGVEMRAQKAAVGRLRTASHSPHPVPHEEMKEISLLQQGELRLFFTHVQA